MKFATAVALLLIACAPLSGQVLAVAPELPILVTTQNGELRGQAVELLKEAARRAKTQVTIETQPWPRALASATVTKDLLLFPVAKTAERDALFQWLGPVNRLVYKVFRLAKGTTPAARTLDELLPYHVGVLRNDAAWNYFRNTQPKQDLEEQSEYENLVSMFFGGRFEYLAVVPSSFNRELERLGRSKDSVEELFALKDITPDPYSYVVVAKGSNPALITGLRAAFDSMLADGSWEAIFRKYQ